MTRSATRHSCIYRGRVVHHRRLPRAHDFGYRLFMLYLDLDELEDVFCGRWLWSLERWNVASFRRADYFGDPDVPLRTAVLDRVESEIGRRPVGPVRMLTHARYFGYAFNPVTFYYCFDASGETVDAVVAEITNTPWKERHSYVLDPRAVHSDAADMRWRFDKAFHVSPFLSMDHVYDWRFGTPDEQLSVHMENHKDGELWFTATLSMQREPLGAGSLARALIRHPFMTGKVIAGIYLQALRLKLKRIPFYDHPKTRTARAE